MENTGLLLIDIQNDYFPKGRYDLDGMEKAAKNATKVLKAFRERELPIYHVRHENEGEEPPFFARGTMGAQIHDSVAPEGDEAVVLKHKANSFYKTHLQELLKRDGITHLVICGSMSHMCIDTTVRAARDLGYECTVIHNSCATHALEFGDEVIPAEQVHITFMAALDQDFADMATADTFVKTMPKIEEAA